MEGTSHVRSVWPMYWGPSFPFLIHTIRKLMNLIFYSTTHNADVHDSELDANIEIISFTVKDNNKKIH